jgi:hypothetical protein
MLFFCRAQGHGQVGGIMAALETSPLQKAQEKLKAVLEEGKIELYFGKEDTKEALGELQRLLEKVEHDIADVGATLSVDTKAAMQRFGDALVAITNKLLH